MTLFNAALEMLDEGFAPIPVLPTTKHPPMAWGSYADSGEPPSPEELDVWFRAWPDASLAIITGPLSGVVVVDCDNPGAIEYARQIGLTDTPIRARTRRGVHYYFRCPEDRWVKSFVGAGLTSTNKEWPACKGLDLRGSKGIAVIPPSPNYTWDIDPGHDWADLPDFPELEGPFPEIPEDLRAAPKVANSTQTAQVLPFTGFAGRDLSTVTTGSVWDETRKLVEESGKLESGAGNGRDARLWRAISEDAAKGYRGADLTQRAIDFMSEFYVEAIDLRKVESMIERVERMEAQNHPDREVRRSEGGEKEGRREERKSSPAEDQPHDPTAQPQKRFTPITTADITRLETELGSVEYFIEPWLPTSGTIAQIFGYSGHGKSKFARGILYAAAAGYQGKAGSVPAWGPFILGPRQPKVLYFDYENSRRNVVSFLSTAKASYGDAGDNFQIWAPFDDRDTDLNLKSDEGLKNFQTYVEQVRPDVIVIDTIRSAFAGLEENSAQDWSRINQLALAIRNAGASCILMHHSNKPGDSGLGREAGSSNQLTTLETQLRVTQVYEDGEVAKSKAAIHDGSLASPVWPRLNTYPAVQSDEQLYMVSEIRYGKVREWTEAHEQASYLGYVSNHKFKTERIHALKSAKQKALLLCQPWVNTQGAICPPKSNKEIASIVGVPESVVEEWTAPYRGNPPSQKAHTA